MVIGNIVTNSKVSVGDEFNIITSEDDAIIGIPTLIVGWDYISIHYPQQDILSKRISEDVFWTFSRNEKRDMQELDIYDFREYCYYKLVRNVNYVFIDPIQYSKKKMLKILRKIYTSKDIISCKYKDMVYISTDNIIFGVDLTLIEFLGFNVDRLVNKVKGISQTFLLGESIYDEYSTYLSNLNYKPKYLPYLYHLNHK